jgi:signal peptidase II
MSEIETRESKGKVEMATIPEPIEPSEETKELTPVDQEGAPASTRQRSLLFLVAALVIVLDQLSKLLIEAALPLNQTWAPIPALATYFRITHVSNTGIAFGLFPAGSLFFAFMAIVVTLAIITYNYILPGGQTLFRLALGLQLGGALGNLIDRVRLGHVTDFLDFGPWPVFNVADTSIVAGVVILGWLMLKEQKQGPTAGREATMAEPRVGPHPHDEWSAS